MWMMCVEVHLMCVEMCVDMCVETGLMCAEMCGVSFVLRGVD